MSVNPDEIKLSGEQRAALARASELAGKSWEDILSDALRPYGSIDSVADNGSAPRTLFDSLGDAIGLVKNSPPDLSTNADYLNGFGRDSQFGPA
jgi:hypothetical protein